MFPVFIWKAILLYCDIHYSELIYSCYYVHLLWGSGPSLLSGAALSQSHFRTIEMEGKEAAPWIIHPGRCHLLVSAWTITQSSHVPCNLHMLTVTSPRGYRIDISNKICLKANSWFSTPAPNLQPYLFYFSTWKLPFLQLLGKKKNVKSSRSPVFLLHFPWWGGHILGWPPWFLHPRMLTLMHSPPLGCEWYQWRASMLSKMAQHMGYNFRDYVMLYGKSKKIRSLKCSL